MAPFFTTYSSNLSRRSAHFPNISEQWTSPGDIFSILLILGGDIVQRALAQLVSPRTFLTPVAFSFGWVAYAVSSVVAVIGEGKLMPLPDCQCSVIDAQSGYIRNNNSWIIGRVVRDWEYKPEWHGYALVVTVVKAVGGPGREAGVPILDRPWWIGVLCIVVQLAISVIPGVLHGSWSCLVITAGGTFLSLSVGGLRQWRREKWSGHDLSRSAKHKTAILTQGNGSLHALVVISQGEGLDLEKLAGARKVQPRSTLPAVICLAILWIVLLLTAAGVQDNMWYLLLVGGLGMAQNLYAAGARRGPSAFGIHLEHVVDIHPSTKEKMHPANKVFEVLKRVDEFHDEKLGFDRQSSEKTGLDHVGLALLPIYFPGQLRPAEEIWKQQRIQFYADKAAEREREKALNSTAGSGSTVQPVCHTTTLTK